MAVPASAERELVALAPTLFTALRARNRGRLVRGYTTYSVHLSPWLGGRENTSSRSGPDDGLRI